MYPWHRQVAPLSLLPSWCRGSEKARLSQQRPAWMDGVLLRMPPCHPIFLSFFLNTFLRFSQEQASSVPFAYFHYHYRYFLLLLLLLHLFFCYSSFTPHHRHCPTQNKTWVTRPAMSDLAALFAGVVAAALLRLFFFCYYYYYYYYYYHDDDDAGRVVPLLRRLRRDQGPSARDTRPGAPENSPVVATTRRRHRIVGGAGGDPTDDGAPRATTTPNSPVVSSRRRQLPSAAEPRNQHQGDRRPNFRRSLLFSPSYVFQGGRPELHMPSSRPEPSVGGLSRATPQHLFMNSE